MCVYVWYVCVFMCLMNVCLFFGVCDRGVVLRLCACMVCKQSEHVSTQCSMSLHSFLIVNLNFDYLPLAMFQSLLKAM